MYEIKKFYGPILSGAATGAGVGSIAGPIGAAAGAVIGAGVSAFSQSSQNKKSRQWQEKMYGVQRQDALTDWANQNAYNSPEQQMQRLKDAGLNPNLVYGNGAVANSSSAARPSSPGSWNPKAIDGGSIGGAIQQGVFAPLDMEIKRQQLKNLQTQQNVMNADIIKKTADTGFTGVRTNRGLFDLSLGKDLRENAIQTAEANLRSINTRSELGVAQTGSVLTDLDIKNKYGMDTAKQNLENMQQTSLLRAAANARAESTNVADLKIKAQQILNMAQDKTKSWEETERIHQAAAGIRRSNTLQDLDIYMKSAGFNWNDPMLLRQLRMNTRGYEK